jgi:hypothetical protein
MQALAWEPPPIPPIEVSTCQNNSISNEKRMNLPLLFKPLNTRNWPVFNDQSRVTLREEFAEFTFAHTRLCGQVTRVGK